LAFAIAAPLMMDAETSYIAILLAASAIPVFLGGFGEDTGFDVSPKTRLVLSFVSAAIAGVLLGVWVERTGIPFIDSALSIAFVSYLFTMLIAGAICHATNLVDGLNGLSLGLSLMMSVALTIISFAVGDIVMAQICLLLVGALGGVFIFNFPLGKIFLGDAGAYTIGHMLTWIAILLLSRNEEIAPFSMFLVFFWPLADMLFAILRRIRNGKPIDQPDRMHFHQFVMRAIELTIVNNRLVSNPIAAVTTCALASLPTMLSVWLYDANLLAGMAWLTCFVLFIWTYVAGIRLARYLSRARKNKENLAKTISREGFRNLRSAAGGSKTFPAE
jgi:UDP-N-acetylmuramyl pentapeptide phosphotransferase/UDP-N-acetylglucosamine-1-phosphate transferase